MSTPATPWSSRRRGTTRTKPPLTSSPSKRNGSPPGSSPRAYDLQPALAAEVDELRDGRDDDQAPRPPVAVCPVELRDVAEVLALHPDDECRDEQDRGNRRQALHDLVLILGHHRLVVVACAGDQVAAELERLRRAQELVVGVGEVQLDVV